jgi:tetratricopeptide (TPR) repeat protein
MKSKMDSTKLTNKLQHAAQLQVARRFKEAEEIYRDVLRQHPKQPDALHLLGVIYAQAERMQEAIELIKRAIAIRPNASEYHNNLGNIYIRQGLTEEAMAAFSRAVELRPDYTKALSNLGGVLKKTGRYAAAMHAYERAISVTPTSGEAHWNMGLLLLLQGQLKRGWAEYEYRFEVPELRETKRQCSQPRWDGSDLRGKTILLHAEQGFGDAIQFARYIPLVAQKNGRIVVEVQPELQRLFASIAGIDVLVARPNPLPAFDVHCPLMSLPHVFGTTLETIPDRIPYLAVPGALKELWGGLAGTSRRKIGLVWAGNPTHRNDRNRSIPPSILLELIRTTEADFISLQKPRANDGMPNGQLTDFTDELTDFADTAAVIENLDLVIAVDTAVAHLAGALGKPAWVLVPNAPDWRWLLDRDNSPWYPTVRLFRQPRPGDWSAVVLAVADQLKEFCRGKVI